MKELQFIEIIKKTLPSSCKYIGDDTAFLSDKGIIITQDTLVEDVHFRLTTISPFQLGYKSIAVNLSDIAAGAAIAKYCLISLSLPKNINNAFIEGFYKGVKAICEFFNVDVIGGDITGAEKLTVSITAIGYTEGVQPASRKNAKENDIVFVTGHFGSSAAGLWCLENNYNSDKFIKSHLMPMPRLTEARKILEKSKHPLTLMDASDGLADALAKISSMSEVSMEINAIDIPIDSDIKNIAGKANINSYYDWILFGGEDYELVGTMPESLFNELNHNELNIKKIGKVIKKELNSTVFVQLNDKTLEINMETLNQQTFDHFKED
ncbi:MAG: thiamine-phosphate kinase [bacterium]